MAAGEYSGNSETNEGAKDTYTGRFLLNMRLTLDTSSLTFLAPDGQINVQRPQKMHNSRMIDARLDSIFIAFTGHSRMHL
ncbi:hypothetical protein MASR1M74_00450 [Lentimicrobium sp.]